MSEPDYDRGLPFWLVQAEAHYGEPEPADVRAYREAESKFIYLVSGGR